MEHVHVYVYTSPSCSIGTALVSFPAPHMLWKKKGCPELSSIVLHKVNHNKFAVLHFLPPLKFPIKETGLANWQKKVKLKSCLPSIAQADITFSLNYQEHRGKKRSFVSSLSHPR